MEGYTEEELEAMRRVRAHHFAHHRTGELQPAPILYNAKPDHECQTCETVVSYKEVYCNKCRDARKSVRDTERGRVRRARL